MAVLGYKENSSCQRYRESYCSYRHLISPPSWSLTHRQLTSSSSSSVTHRQLTSSSSSSSVTATVTSLVLRVVEQWNSSLNDNFLNGKTGGGEGNVCDLSCCRFKEKSNRTLSACRTKKTRTSEQWDATLNAFIHYFQRKQKYFTSSNYCLLKLPDLPGLLPRLGLGRKFRKKWREKKNKFFLENKSTWLSPVIKFRHQNVPRCS